MNTTKFSEKVNAILDDAKQKIDKLNWDLDDKYAGEFFKQGDSAVAVIGKDKDGDLEFIEWTQGQEDSDFIVSLSKEYIYTSDVANEIQTVKNSFGKEITAQQYKEIMMQEFNKVLDKLTRGN